MHELYSQFKKNSNLYPNNIAIIFNNKKYTYLDCEKTIEELSNSFNVFKNKAIIIYIKKSEYSVLLQLAINKSGNVFVMVDENTPLLRLLEIVNQVNPKWIITDKNKTSLNNIEEYHLVSNNINPDLICYEPHHHKEPNLYNNEVTHLFFSSGSTGKPKGILLNDKPVVSVTLQQAQLIHFNDKSSFAWLLSPGFDASLSDIYLTLFSGGTLHICDFPQTKIKQLMTYFNNNKITHSDLSPAILHLINPKNLPYLHTIIFGGEIANEKVIHSFSKLKHMYNAYGPTETTICSSMKKVDDKWTSNNVGKPLNKVLYKITENKELHIGGEHLSIGYNINSLNEEKFYIENGITYYKTGDLFSINMNGDYLYLGRLDRQFKYNGILISPEEIENIFIRLGCSKALCKLEDKINLYYVGNITSEDLRKKINDILPINMIPHNFIKVDNFNYNINGKMIT